MRASVDASQQTAICRRYRLARPIGSGGSAEVHLARDVLNGDAVAIKLLRSDRVGLPEEQHVLKEYQLLRDLGHQAFPEMLALRRARDGRPFIAMEWIDGIPLERRPRPLVWREETLLAAYHLASSLASLHARGWAHLDLKPANVILMDGDERGGALRTRVRLLDAGLMARIGERIDSRGTLGYMAPEIAQGRDWDERADLFSLGAVLYRMTAGRKAYAGATPEEILRHTVSGRRIPLASSQPSLPPPFAELVDALIDPAPERRPATAAEVMSALDRISDLEGWPLPERDMRIQPWRRPIPWPPVPRPETESILAALETPPDALLRLIGVSARPGMGRESFARDLADRLALRGHSAELLCGERERAHSPQEAEGLWARVLGVEELADLEDEAPEPRHPLEAVADAMWRESCVLVWELGPRQPEWLARWLQDLAILLASCSARSERRPGSPAIVLLCGTDLHLGERLTGVALRPFSLEPLSGEILRAYVEEHSRKRDRAAGTGDEADPERLIRASRGYPEVLAALSFRQGALPEHAPEAPPDEETPLQILVRMLAHQTERLPESARRALMVLEHAGMPLDAQTWRAAASLPGEDFKSAQELLEANGFIIERPDGWSVVHADLLEAGHFLTRPPQEADHLAMAEALRSSHRKETADLWKARAEHLRAAGAREAARVVLAAGLRLYREGRLDEAFSLLRSWHDAPESGRHIQRSIWIRRLLLELAWETRRWQDFRSLQGALPPGDPLVISLAAREESRGRSGEATARIREMRWDHLSKPLRAFVMASRALALARELGPEEFCRQALEAASVFPPRGLTTLRGLLLQRIVQAFLWIGDLRNATRVREQLKKLAVQEEAGAFDFAARMAEGYVAYKRADLDEAMLAAERALYLARRTGHVNQQVASLSLLGASAADAGQWDEAVRAYHEILAISRLLGDRAGEQTVLCNLACGRNQQALYEPALERAREALALAEEMSDPRRRLSVLPFLIESLLAMGRPEDARQAGEELRRLLREDTSEFDRALALNAIARSAATGDPAAGREIHPVLAEEAYTAFLEAGMADDAAELALEIAWEALREESLDEAEAWMKRAESFPRGKVRCLDIRRALVRARHASATGTWSAPAARTLWGELETARREARQWGYYELLWRLDYVAAHALLVLGDRRAALATLEQAWRTLSRITENMKDPRHREGYLARPDQMRFLRLLESLGRGPSSAHAGKA